MSIETDAYFQAHIEECFNLIKLGLFIHLPGSGGWLRGPYDRNQDYHHSIEMKFVTSHYSHVNMTDAKF